ncbi:MAG: Gfo/Idh/MocA family oxidoreductase, partial [Chloroflexia bacterium]|nr:Gfo/Idh/MocA family oxidoreductase [Chloroflexia bacterium]
MTEAVRMGVVGAGTIAQRGILPHLIQADVQDQVRLQAICDPVEGRAQAAADTFGIPYATTTFEDLLENGEVTAVTIASPIGLHYEQGKAAL